MELKCIYCDKVYKTQQSRSNHHRIYHKSSKMNTEQLSSNDTITSPMVNIMSSNPTTINIDKKYTCKNCNAVFTTRQSKSRHMLKTCNKQKNLELNIDKNEYLQSKIEKIENDYLELNTKYNELLKLCKIHPKTLQKINNQLINSNNNINNGTINNNTINIVKFGSEDLNKVFSQSEILKILNRKMCSLEESIKTIHFNDKRPEFKNIYITNLKDKYAYIYNGSKFIAVLKSDILEELVDIHFENIEYSADEYKHKLQPKTIEVLEKFIEKMNNDEDEFIDQEHKLSYPNFKNFNNNKIKLMIYNESDKKSNIVNVICEKNEKPTIEG